jgi:hypothetical protein
LLVVQLSEGVGGGVSLMLVLGLDLTFRLF